MNWTSHKIWVDMMIWTVIYLGIAYIVQTLASSRALFFGLIFHWMGTPPTAVWIIGMIVIVHAYLANVPFTNQILRELIAWTAIYVVFVYSLVFLPTVFTSVIFLIGAPPSAIWVIGILIIVYRKLRP